MEKEFLYPFYLSYRVEWDNNHSSYGERVLASTHNGILLIDKIDKCHESLLDTLLISAEQGQCYRNQNDY